MRRPANCWNWIPPAIRCARSVPASMPNGSRSWTVRSSAPAWTHSVCKLQTHSRLCCNDSLKSAEVGGADEISSCNIFSAVHLGESRRYEYTARTRAGLRRTSADVLGAAWNACHHWTFYVSRLGVSSSVEDISTKTRHHFAAGSFGTQRFDKIATPTRRRKSLERSLTNPAPLYSRRV